MLLGVKLGAAAGGGITMEMLGRCGLEDNPIGVEKGLIHQSCSHVHLNPAPKLLTKTSSSWAKMTSGSEDAIELD